jgi:pimeloyl-ACP methyl ester carboxylesterase
MKHFGASLQGPLRALVGRPEIAGMIMQTGMVGASADTALLVQLLEGIASCDLKMFLATYEAIAGDSAPELLSGIGVPVLLVAGDHDRFVPLRVVEEMHELIPNSSLEVYEKATHYLPIEYPARLSTDLRKFLSGLS